MDSLLDEMANEKRDSDTGKFVEKYSSSDFVDAIRECGGMASTSEVANDVSCPHSTAYYRLDQLRDAGRIDSRQIGNAVLWVVTDE